MSFTALHSEAFILYGRELTGLKSSIYLISTTFKSMQPTILKLNEKQSPVIIYQMHDIFLLIFLYVLFNLISFKVIGFSSIFTSKSSNDYNSLT